MSTTANAHPLNHHRRSEVILLKAAFCLCFFFLSFAHASEPTYDLNDYSEYFSIFTPTLKDRIRKDAQEASRSYKMTPQESLTACANYWIYKCRALEKHGEICQNDRTKTETEFQIWLKDVNDVYKGISCLQSMRWAREKVRKNPSLYLHAE